MSCTEKQEEKEIASKNKLKAGGKAFRDLETYSEHEDSSEVSQNLSLCRESRNLTQE